VGRAPAARGQEVAVSGLFVRDPWLQLAGGEWGSWAYVRSYSPDAGECAVVKMWAPTWLEAIETALAAALTL
jgi:hypothetical protein